MCNINETHIQIRKQILHMLLADIHTMAKKINTKNPLTHNMAGHYACPYLQQIPLFSEYPN